jgi:hypothetical protein
VANVFEVATVFPTERWTLVGGLMVQAHAVTYGINVIRPTNDLDMLLHIEMVTGLAGEVNAKLAALGCRLREASSARVTSTDTNVPAESVGWESRCH